MAEYTYEQLQEVDEETFKHTINECLTHPMNVRRSRYEIVMSYIRQMESRPDDSVKWCERILWLIRQLQSLTCIKRDIKLRDPLSERVQQIIFEYLFNSETGTIIVPRNFPMVSTKQHMYDAEKYSLAKAVVYESVLYKDTNLDRDVIGVILGYIRCSPLLNLELEKRILWYNPITSKPQTT